ncbi:MAG TPA: hypothetical protein VL995_20565 [Cellvibrio sp.]|nr:hypothetical protein [Cellvibrio sp.]
MKKLYIALFVISASWGLSGCGGGGGSGGTQPSSAAPVVSSSAPALSSAGVSSTATSLTQSSRETSSAPVQSSIAASSVAPSSMAASSVAEAKTLTLRGVVVADGLAEGQIVYTIGSETYTTEIDDALGYEITLDVPNEASNIPFTAVATGSGADHWVQLAAIYPSINQLKNLANDGVLDDTEYLGVNISPATTAEYAIISSRQMSVDTDVDYTYALLQVNGAEKLNHAAYLANYLNDIDMDLPSKYETTLEMLLDRYNVDAQLRLHREANDNFLSSEIADIEADSNQTVISQAPITGKYLLKGDGFSYFLTFDADGTGLMLTSNSPGFGIWAGDGKYHEVPFTWEREQNTIEIIMNQPITYGKTIGYDNKHQLQCANTSTIPETPDCLVTMRRLLISLAADTPVGRSVNLQLDVNAVNGNSQIVWSSEGNVYKANLLDASLFYKLTAEELQGFEWFTNNYHYKFNADGTATRIDTHTNDETQVSWQLEDGQIMMDGDSLVITPLYPQGPGLKVMQLLGDNLRSLSVGAFHETLFVKQEKALSMEESDWVGRWTRGFENYFSVAADFYATGEFRDGFETKQMGSWSTTNEKHITGMSNGAWRMEFELLAIKDGKHYLHRCEGTDSENFVPTWCVVEPYVIDKSFSGTTLWETWSNPLFENVETGEYWQFWGLDLYIFGQNSLRNVKYKKIAPHLFLDVLNWRFMELLSSSVDQLQVCDYNTFNTCSESDSFELVRAPELKINITGSGSVFYDTREFKTTGSMMVRKEAKTLIIQPGVGHAVLNGNISGCDGTLSGTQYAIPAPTVDCEISVTFTAIP